MPPAFPAERRAVDLEGFDRRGLAHEARPATRERVRDPPRGHGVRAALAVGEVDRVRLRLIPRLGCHWLRLCLLLRRVLFLELVPRFATVVLEVEIENLAEQRLL